MEKIMFSTLAVITTVAFIILFILLLYITICLIDIILKLLKSSGKLKEVINKGSKFNIFLIIVTHAIKKKAGTSNESVSLLKKAMSILVKILGIADFWILVATCVTLALSLVFQQLAYGETAASLVLTWLKGDDDCTCYLKCTGDDTIDQENTYLEIFGPYEYQKLLNSMSLTQSESEFLDQVSYSYDTLWTVKKKEVGTDATINQLKTSEYQSNLSDAESELKDYWEDTASETRDTLANSGKGVISSMGGMTYIVGSDSISVVGTSMNTAANMYLIELLSLSLYNQGSTRDDIASTYSNSIVAIGSFRNDGLDRSSMDTEQLMSDLFDLLKDTKINGRNQNCPVCGSARSEKLHKKCMGVDKWEMEPYYVVCNDQTIVVDDTQDTTDEEDNDIVTDYIGTASAKNSQYGLCIDSANDIWVYWYHQTLTTCQWNPQDSTYGYYGSCILYKEYKSSGKTAMDRGCSTYSTALALSKATPTYDSSHVVYVLPLSGNGISDVTDKMSMDMGTLGKNAVSAYSNYGLKYEVISFTQDKVDEVLAKGGMVINSYQGSDGTFAWYKGSGHFIVIRSKDSNGMYYNLNSCVLKGQTDADAPTMMTTGVTWSSLYAHKNHDSALAFWVEGGVQNTGSTTVDANSGIIFVGESHMVIADSYVYTDQTKKGNNPGYYIESLGGYEVDENAFFVHTGTSSDMGYASWLSSGAVTKIDAVMSAHSNIKSWKIVVQHGASTSQGDQSDWQEYISVYKTLSDKYGDIYIMPTPPVTKNGTGHFSQTKVSAYNSYIRDTVCGGNSKLHYIDCSSQYDKNNVADESVGANSATDINHYNAETYARVLDYVAKQVNSSSSSSGGSSGGAGNTNKVSINVSAGTKASDGKSCDAEYVISFFMNNGYNKGAAIGIAANFRAESSYSAIAGSTSSHYGLAQWGSGRLTGMLDYVNSHPEMDMIDAELMYALAEMTGGYAKSMSQSALNPYGDPSQNGSAAYATKRVAQKYEICPNKGKTISWSDNNSYSDSTFIDTTQGGAARLNYAKELVDKYGDT
jgi:hypothetical protein